MDELAIASVLTAAAVPQMDVAAGLDRARSEIDLALWTLLGRTAEDALDRLNADPVTLGLRASVAASVTASWKQPELLQ